MILRELLQRSRASAPFRHALTEFARTGAASDRVAFDAFAPPIKVERTLTRMLEAYPEVEIERVEIRASSGCEYFAGELTLHAPDGARLVRFRWDCRWRAEQEGWVDYFGFPDQTRAAREFGHDCFRDWTEVDAPRDVAAV